MSAVVRTQVDLDAAIAAGEETTTPETRAELARLMGESTPRPWYAPMGDDRITCDGANVVSSMAYGYDGHEVVMEDADRALIVAAVNALPALLADSAELAAARAKLAAVRELADEWSADAARLRADGDIIWASWRELLSVALLAIIDGRADS